MARRLANRAANDVTPQVLADEARAIAETHGLAIDVIDEKRAAELGMGMFLAVGQGSDNPPRMIVLRSGDAGEKDALGRHLALVGKGVCFDSGGISIKSADRMDEMKMDKIGACTVIAAIATVSRLAPGLPLLAVAPAVENMPGGHASRPGDIVKALNGKWVDLINTDAEGRLILGDAMTYAEQLGATHLVDVATLTGAVGRAIGNLVTGVFATPDPWWGELSAAAERAGERYWRFPLVAGLHVRDGELVRGLPEHRHERWIARQERPVPGAVPDRAVGPPRHRRHRRTSARRTRTRRAGPRVSPTPRSWSSPSRERHGTERVATRRLHLRRRARPAVRRAPPTRRSGRADADRHPARDPGRARGGSSPTGSAPAGPPMTTARVRPIDWRTPVAVVTGALALAGLTSRFAEPVPMVVFGAYLVALVLLLATDLDQRLLPDVITLPAIPLALVFDLLGLNPLVPPGALPIAILVAIAVPGLMYLISIPFGAGCVRTGRRQAAGVGGPARRAAPHVLRRGLRGAAGGRRVIVVLLALRRITLKSYIPFGPFLIFGAMWAILAIP